MRRIIRSLLIFVCLLAALNIFAVYAQAFGAGDTAPFDRKASLENTGSSRNVSDTSDQKDEPRFHNSYDYNKYFYAEPERAKANASNNTGTSGAAERSGAKTSNQKKYPPASYYYSEEYKEKLKNQEQNAPSNNIAVLTVLGIMIFISAALMFVFIMLRRDHEKNAPSLRGHISGIPIVHPGSPDDVQELKDIAYYSKIDGNFDPSALRDRISDVCIRFRNCLNAKDLSEVRPFFTDTLYKQFERRIATNRIKRKASDDETVSVKQVELLGYYQSGDHDHIVANVTMSVKERSEKNSRRSSKRTIESSLIYKYDLARKKGVGTIKKEDAGKVRCPTCDALVDVNVSARCSFCGGLIPSSDKDWTVSKITALSQKTI